MTGASLAGVVHPTLAAVLQMCKLMDQLTGVKGVDHQAGGAKVGDEQNSGDEEAGRGVVAGVEDLQGSHLSKEMNCHLLPRL